MQRPVSHSLAYDAPSGGKVSNRSTPPAIIRQILWGTPGYQQELQLRHAIMRQPLGLSLYEEDLDAEKNDIHFGLYLEEDLAGAAVLRDQGQGVIYLRQIAIQPCYQGQGLGKLLLNHAEAFACQQGYARLTMHARATATGFYQKLGYHSVGQAFIQIGLPHIIMEKDLR